MSVCVSTCECVCACLCLCVCVCQMYLVIDTSNDVTYIPTNMLRKQNAAVSLGQPIDFKLSRLRFVRERCGCVPCSIPSNTPIPSCEDFGACNLQNTKENSGPPSAFNFTYSYCAITAHPHSIREVTSSERHSLEFDSCKAKLSNHIKQFKTWVKANGTDDLAPYLSPDKSPPKICSKSQHVSSDSQVWLLVGSAYEGSQITILHLGSHKMIQSNVASGNQASGRNRQKHYTWRSICCELPLMQASSNNGCILGWTIVSAHESGSWLEHGTGVVCAHALSLWVMQNTCFATRKAKAKRIKQTAGNAWILTHPNARLFYHSTAPNSPWRPPQTLAWYRILFLPLPPTLLELTRIVSSQPRSNPCSVCRSPKPI